MKALKIILKILVVIAVIILAISYVCYRIAFYVTKKQRQHIIDTPIPSGKAYEPYYDRLHQWVDNARNLSYEEFCITSFDGLKLYGKYYECAPNAPIELMFHGYRGGAERDLCGGIQRCFKLGRNCLIVDQRASGKSEGNVITFGVNESKDCLKWIDFMIEHFGMDVKIILTGISMGASTVLMAAGRELPSNVVGVLADCGYSTARDIIKKCVRQIHLPADILYPFIKLGAKIYGHFDLEEYTPVEAMKTCQLPVIFFHGESDDFVPGDMSQITYDACSSAKRIEIIPDADHGIAYLLDPERYLNAVAEFFTENGVETKVL